MSVAPDCPLPLIYTDLVFSNIHSSDSATLPGTLSNSLSWGGYSGLDLLNSYQLFSRIFGRW